jgi:hypothetical protein
MTLRRVGDPRLMILRVAAVRAAPLAAQPGRRPDFLASALVGRFRMALRSAAADRPRSAGAEPVGSAANADVTTGRAAALVGSALSLLLRTAAGEASATGPAALTPVWGRLGIAKLA